MVQLFYLRLFLGTETFFLLSVATDSKGGHGIDRPLIPSSDVTTRKSGGDSDWLIVQTFAQLCIIMSVFLKCSVCVFLKLISFRDCDRV